MLDEVKLDLLWFGIVTNLRPAPKRRPGDCVSKLLCKPSRHELRSPMVHSPLPMNVDGLPDAVPRSRDRRNERGLIPTVAAFDSSCRRSLRKLGCDARPRTHGSRFGLAASFEGLRFARPPQR